MRKVKEAEAEALAAALYVLLPHLSVLYVPDTASLQGIRSFETWPPR